MTPTSFPRAGRTFVEVREERWGNERHAVTIMWYVEEVRDLSDGSAIGRCLVFTSDNAMRRVMRFPDNWMALGDRELLAVSWQR